MSDDESGFDEEELRQAIALSLQDQKERPGPLVEPQKAQHSSGAAGDSPSAALETKGSSALHQLDRRAMEQERLARLARKRPAEVVDISPPPSSRRKVEADTTAGDVVQHEATRNSDSSSTNHLKDMDSSATSLPYPRGVVKKTWCLGQPREGDDIKIEEVLQRQHLKRALISSYNWDLDWLVSKIPTRGSTELIFVFGAKTDSERRRYRDFFDGLPHVRLCFPPMPGNVFCMHSKLMLLTYDKYLRVVIPTANITPYDWGESGILENSVFIIDLPKKGGGKSTDAELQHFGRELLYFCDAMGLDSDLLKAIRDYDFANTQGLAFVHTIGGNHTEDGPAQSWRKTGYCGLGRAITNLGIQTDNQISLDFLTSSIGAINDEFLTRLYLACQGDDGEKELTWRTNAKNTLDHTKGKANGLVKARSKVANADNSQQNATLAAARSNIRVYFPSNDTVTESRGGHNAGGVIFLSPKTYNAAPFPKSCLWDLKSTRTGVLMHNKILYVRPQQATAQPSCAWAYVGSANCSPSAWGRLTFEKTKKQVKLNCRNWECGVVVPVSRKDLDQQGKTRAPLKDSLSVFDGTVPVPLQYPGRPMLARKPWFQTDQAQEQDS